MKKILWIPAAMAAALALPLASCSDELADVGAGSVPSQETTTPSTPTPGEDSDKEWDDSRQFGPVAEPLILSAEEQDMVKAQNDFALKMLDKTLASSENTVFSPVAFNNVVGMLSMVTEEKANPGSKEKLAKAMGITTGDFLSFYSATQKVREYIQTADPSASVTAENALFSDAELFLSKLFHYWFNPTGLEMNLSDSARERMQQWIAGVTNGMLGNVNIPDINPDEPKTYLSSALTFKANWRGFLDVSEPAIYTDFHNANGSVSRVRMMSKYSSAKVFGIFGGKNYTMMCAPYGNKAFDMLLVLPDKGVTLEQLASTLSEADVRASLEWKNRFKNITQCLIPFFHVEADFDLSSRLREFGLDGIYLDTYLGSVSRPTPLNFMLSKTSLTVNEKGTEGASMVLSGYCGDYPSDDEPIEFIADRPFLYIVRERSTGAFILMGAVTDLSNQIIIP